MCGTPTYRTWKSIVYRCYNKNASNYYRYGGRGITVCDEWRHKFGFPKFLEDMGSRPSSKHSIDRINNNGPYSKENCRWATTEEQSNNKRTTIYIEYNEKRLTMKEWSKITGITYSALEQRRRAGWSISRMLDKPLRK